MEQITIIDQKNEDLFKITRSNGIEYTLRKDRHRYFFPDEWTKFIVDIKNLKHKLFFMTLLHSGARAMEGLHLKPEDIDEERGVIKLKVIKQMGSKKGYSTSSPRQFFVSYKLIRAIKFYVNKFNVKPNEYLFLNNEKLPENYISLTNKEKRKYFTYHKSSYDRMLKYHLKRIGIEDYYMFSLHNIRKTYGNWMRLFINDINEICYRMGNIPATFREHYGSSLLFSQQDKIKIQRILGDVR